MEAEMARPQSTFLLVYLALLCLLAVTIGSAQLLQLGAFKPVVNLGIATVKAVLIAWFFMHVREGSGLVRLFSGAASFWLLILFGVSLSDYLTRAP
jgi:cytochrome c oxidase subunit IV